MDEIAATLATPSEVTLSTGRTVLIHHFSYRQFTQIILLVRDLNIGKDELETLKGLDGAGMDGIASALVMFADRSDKFISILAKATKLPENEIEELDLADVLVLFMKCVEVNGDFFVHRLLPMLAGVKESMGRKLAGQK